MNSSYVDIIDPLCENEFPIRLVGEISSLSCDLLNISDEEFNCFSLDNEMIFQLQGNCNKETYFCEYINEKILLNAIFAKKINYSYENPLIVKILHSYTRQKSNDIFTTPSIVFTPMTGGIKDVRRITMCIDILLHTTADIFLGELTKKFIHLVNVQLLEFKKSYAFHHYYIHEKKNLRLISLHYLLDTKHLTIILPEKSMDHENDLLGEVSRELNLEKTIRRAESLYPPKDIMDVMTGNGDKLVNPHSSINTKFAESHMVKGRYTYYHYMQDGLDDSGWGCAYRSLQTIVSWYIWQGWTTVAVPSHRDIQLCLVTIKDKDQTFIDSRAWIGSFEITLVLQALLSVESRIVSLTGGRDLESVYDQLASHFDDWGAPVMIGGGQLAHTILGVSRDRAGKARFLVLDPHFKGPGGDAAVITGKGWCAWKELSFWKEALPYNLCLPTRPAVRP